jgi:hypothetical protein
LKALEGHTGARLKIFILIFSLDSKIESVKVFSGLEVLPLNLKNQNE